MIVAENLVKTFVKNEKKGKKINFKAVDNISIEVEKGEIVGILGPNGAGKTTLLRMLGLLMKPSEGKVYLKEGEKVISDEMAIKKNIGYLSNNTKLYGRLSPRELLTMVGEIHGMSKEEMEGRINELSNILDMEGFIDNRIEKLSTGQTQKSSIARCLMHNPDIYIFDEPTLGLDIVSSSAIVDFMKGEKEKGKTVIYSTHYMEEAEYLCDRIIMIMDGRIIAQGTVDSLKATTASNNLRDVFKSLMKEQVNE